MYKTLPNLQILVLSIIILLVVSCSSSQAPTTITTQFPTTTTTTSATPTPTTTPTLAPTPTTTPIQTTATTSTTLATTEPGIYEVRVYWSMVYIPNSITVPVGSTITFILVNGWDFDHPLGFDPPINYSEAPSGDDIHLTYTFTEPGKFNFYCTLHGDSGSVLVE